MLFSLGGSLSTSRPTLKRGTQLLIPISMTLNDLERRNNRRRALSMH